MFSGRVMISESASVYAYFVEYLTVEITGAVIFCR